MSSNDPIMRAREPADPPHPWLEAANVIVAVIFLALAVGAIWKAL